MGMMNHKNGQKKGKVMQNQRIPYQPGLDFGVGVDSATGGRRQFGATGAPQKMQAGITGGDGSFSLFKIEDTHDLETHLGISAEASGGVGLFTASARFSFARDTKVQSSSIMMLMTCTKSFGFTQILKPDLDPSAAPLVANGQVDLFTQRYGDCFVAGVESGGQFFGMIKIDVASESDNTKISGALSGSYGTFSAKVSTDLSEAVKNTHSQVSATLYYQGGNVTTTVRSPDDLFTAKDEWEKTVRDAAEPYAVLLLPWIIANGPNPPNAADLQKQKDVLIACAKLRSQVMDRLNLLEYMTDPLHMNEFQMQAGDADKLAKLHAEVSLDADMIQEAASFAIDNAKQAVEPETYAHTNKGMPNYCLTVFHPSDLPKRCEGEESTLDMVGEGMANADPLIGAIRDAQPVGACRHGFYVGLATEAKNTAWGPGAQSIKDGLDGAAQVGFAIGVAYCLQRNNNIDVAVRGAAVIKADPAVAAVRALEQPAGLYWLGFNIGTGIFGDPTLGALGNTLMGPGSERIRASLDAEGQRGFDAARDFNLKNRRI